MTRRIDVIGDERFLQAESPRWDGRTDELLWVDLTARVFYRGRLRSGQLDVDASIELPGGIGCPAPLPRRGEGWVVAADRGYWHITEGGDISRVTPDVAPYGAFMNDGGCDPSGRFWAGTQSNPRAPRCSLYSLETNGHVVERLTGVTVSNGLAFSADGRTLYYIDTLPHRSIDAFDVAEDGRLSGRRTIATVAGGNPDGMAIDLDGTLWVAVWDAGQVHRYDTGGRLLEAIDIPARRPSAVAFLGSTLIVTSARLGLGEPSPSDGAIFAIELPVGGAPSLPWRGQIAQR